MYEDVSAVTKVGKDSFGLRTEFNCYIYRDGNLIQWVQLLCFPVSLKLSKRWRKVDFDSVFNQSSTTFSFGSPDIIPMFARGAVPGKVKTWCYDEDAEDFTKGFCWILSFLFIFNNWIQQHFIIRCDCTGYLGFRSFENTIEERDDRSGFGFSTSFREGNNFPSLARTRHYRPFL